MGKRHWMKKAVGFACMLSLILVTGCGSENGQSSEIDKQLKEIIQEETGSKTAKDSEKETADSASEMEENGTEEKLSAEDAKEMPEREYDFENLTEIMECQGKEGEFVEKAEAYLKKAGFTGAVLMAEGDRIFYAKGYGISDKMDSKSAPIDIHSTFEIGSMTKQMTAACILKLEEEGKLKTSDMLGKYFEDYKYGDKISLDMMLHMRSGLKEHIDDHYGIFPEKIGNQIAKAELKSRPLDIDVLPYILDAPLQWEPNSRFVYTNTNYYLLARLVEQVSGMEFKEYMQKNLFDFCHMTETNMNYQETTTKAYDAAGRYYSIPEAVCKGAGEVNSSVIDVYKWNRALMNSKIFQNKEATLQKMLESKGGYACGLYSDSAMIMHGGCTDVFNSMNTISLTSNVMIVVLMNQPIEELSAITIDGNLRQMYNEVVLK